MSTKQSQSLSSQTLVGFKWGGLSVDVQALLQLVILSILARLLTPREFGVVGIALIFTGFVERVGLLGIGPSIVQKEELPSSFIKLAWTVSVFLGSCLFLLMYAASPYLAVFFDESALTTVLRWLSFAFLLESFSVVSASLLERDLEFRKLMLVNNSAYALGTGLVGILMALNGFGVWALVSATIATRFIKAVLLLRLRPQRPTLKISFVELRELLRLGIGFSLGRLFSVIALTGDNFVTGRVLGASMLGMYGRAYQLMTLPSTYFGQILEKVLFPSMAKRQSAPQRLRPIYIYGIEAAALVGLPAGVFMFFAAEPLILFLFGEQWVSVVPTLKILSWGVFFRLCYKNSDTVIRSLGAVYRHAGRQAIYAAMVLIGSWFGAQWGLEGVAIAVVSSVAINYLLLSYFAVELLDVKPKAFIKAHFGALWCCVYLVPVLWFFFRWAAAEQLSPLVSLVLGGILAAISMLAGIASLPSSAKLTVLPWIAGRFKLERFGMLGRVIHRLLR